MRSNAFSMKLRPNCYEEYKRQHDNLWPELIEALRTNGVRSVIFRFGDYLLVYETFPSDEAMARMHNHPISARWNVEMAELLETDETGKIIRQELPRVFSFGDLG